MSASSMRLASFAFMAAMGMCLARSIVAQQREPQRQEVRGLVKSLDAGTSTITITVGGGREAAAAENTYPLAKNVDVATVTGADRFGVYREAKLADLAPGALVSLTLSGDQKTVESIVAEGPTLRGLLKGVDLTKNTLTISPQVSREGNAEEKTYTLAAEAEIAVDDGRGRRYSLREGKATELVAGSLVTIRLSLDQQQIQSLVAEGPSVFGVVKSLDAAKKVLTLTVRPARGEDAAVEKTLAVSDAAVVLVDDGKGRRVSLKEGKLADVPSGSSVIVRLSVDQNSAMFIRAEGPSFTALLKGVDTTKNTVTYAIPRGRGDAPQEKTLAVAEDARINIEGNAAKLAALIPGENGPILQIRLSLDQKSVQSINSLRGR